MPKTTNNHLYDLIKSLSKNEKRYFKINNKNKSINKLFDLINKQEEYDEKELLAKIFPKKKNANISVAKNRLYNQILNMLSLFYTEKSIEKQVKDRIHHIEILYSKGLLTQCLKILNATRKIALENDLNFSLLEINKWEKKIHMRSNYEDLNLEGIEYLNEVDNNATRNIQLYNDIWRVESSLLKRLHLKGKSRNKRDYDEYQDLIKGLRYINEDHLDIESRYLYKHVMSAYYFCIIDYQKSYTVVQSNHKLISENPEIFGAEPQMLLSVISNAIYLSLKTNNPDDTELLLIELEEYYKASQRVDSIDIYLFENRTICLLATLIMKGQYEKANRHIPAIIDKLSHYQDTMNSNQLASIYYSIAIVKYGVQDYNSALKWVNRILNEIKIDQSEDQYCYANILHMIIQLELGDDEFIIHSLRSLKRYLKTRNKMNKFEVEFVELMTQLSRSYADKPDQELYSDFAEKMGLLKSDKYEKSSFEYFDFEAWAIAKSRV